MKDFINECISHTPDSKRPLKSNFYNWLAVQVNEWRDDSCGETEDEFNKRMNQCENDFITNPYDWSEVLEAYSDISDY